MLLFMGLFITLLRPKKWLFFILLYGMGVFVLQGLSVLGPPSYSPRLVPVIPIVFVFVLLTLNTIRTLFIRGFTALGFRKGRGIVTYAIWAYILLIAFINYRIYFDFFLKEKKSLLFLNVMTEVAHTIPPYIDKGYTVAFVGDGSNFLHHDNIQYLTRNKAHGLTMTPESMRWNGLKIHKKIVFLCLPHHKEIRGKIKKRFPGGREFEVQKLDEDRAGLWGYLYIRE